MLRTRARRGLVRTVSSVPGQTKLVVLHDIDLALRYCDRFLLIKEGRVLDCGGPEVITPESIQQVYGISADIITHNGHRIVIPL